MDIAIFISYAHVDKPTAQAIANGLTVAGIRVWIDEGQLRAGDSIIERISTALDDVHFVVAIVSDASIASSWCRKELSLAMTGGLHRKGVQVLPLRLGDVEMPPSLMDTFYLQVDPANPTAIVPRLISDAASHQAEHNLAADAANRTEATIEAAQSAPATVENSLPSIPKRQDAKRDRGESQQPLGRARHDPMLGQPILKGYEPTAMERRHGVVKWFNSEKGFGFIQDGEGVDHFVHYSMIIVDGVRRLYEGQTVTFVPGGGTRGPSALAIVPD